MNERRDAAGTTSPHALKERGKRTRALFAGVYGMRPGASCSTRLECSTRRAEGGRGMRGGGRERRRSGGCAGGERAKLRWKKCGGECRDLKSQDPFNLFIKVIRIFLVKSAFFIWTKHLE